MQVGSSLTGIYWVTDTAHVTAARSN